ncbi:MAG: signal recognition particle receptor subunit alpha, partial [Rectinema sp.]|nr:signal recognition particle receptor subunit alpha [Rectinema sp.]
MNFAEKIKSLFRRNRLSEEVYEELTDLLIEGDIGAAFAYELVESLRKKCKTEGISDSEVARKKLKEIIRSHLVVEPFVLDPTRLNIILILGVNGTGKTTSCAKLAYWAQQTCRFGPVLLAAADTFRAAAIDQLKIHGERLGIRVVAQQHGSDPGAVLWDSIDAAKAGGARLVIADTAGRMHTRADLVRELEKLDKGVSQRAADANYRRLLVLDATTGQNAMRQAEIFHSAVKASGIIMTKYDSTAKGLSLIHI